MKIATKTTFRRDVRVFTPIDGGHRQETLKATFNYLGVEEVDKFDLKTTDGTTEFLKAVVARLDGLTDESGADVLYNDEVRDQLFNLQHVRLALCKEFFDTVSKAKSGN